VAELCDGLTTRLLTTDDAQAVFEVIAAFTLGRTLKKRAVDVLAYFDRPGTSNGQAKRSVSFVTAGLGLAGQDDPGRVVRCVTHEAIGPLRRCPSVELSAPSDAAGTIRPTSVT
jgi:hypothetical protein